MKKYSGDSLANDREFLQELCHKIGAAIILVDKETDISRFANNRVANDLSASHDQVVGRTYCEVFSPEFLDFYHDLVECSEDEEECTGIYYWSEKAFWEQVSVTALQWEGRDSILITITNVNEVARNDYEYKQIAYFDGATGLPNERKLEEDINAIDDVETVILLFVKIEILDDVYDMYGWDAGDSLVISIRDWLEETKYRRTHLYRMGNSFIMMARGLTAADLASLANDIRNRFADSLTIPIGNNAVSVYCNVINGSFYGKYVRNPMSCLVMSHLYTVATAG